MNRVDGTPASEPQPTVPDLSELIISMLDKEPADRVTCRRVYGNCYRCNWWAPAASARQDNPGMNGLMVTTHRVRQSRFVTATRTAEGLVLSYPARFAQRA